MKRIIVLLTLTLGLGLATSQAQQSDPNDPDLNIIMKLSDWDKITQIIHKSAVDGGIRDPLIQMIRIQAAYQLRQKYLRDSTLHVQDSVTKASQKLGSPKSDPPASGKAPPVKTPDKPVATKPKS